MTNKTHPITWVSLVFIILTFLFFLASVFILEFAVYVTPDGDIIIPWYYWLFFVGAGVFLVVFVILQSIPVPYVTKENEKVNVREINEVDVRRVNGRKDEDLYSLMK